MNEIKDKHDTLNNTSLIEFIEQKYFHVLRDF